MVAISKPGILPGNHSTTTAFTCPPKRSSPLVISVTNLKGGVGKTTTALNLAYAITRCGETILIDADPNRSALIGGRGITFSEATPLRIMSEREVVRYTGGGCRQFVIDTKARPDDQDMLEVVKSSSLIILPTTVSKDDMRMTVETARLLRKAGSTIHKVVIVKAPTNTVSLQIAKAQAFLEEQQIPVFKSIIRNYIAYDHAFGRGIPVCHSGHENAEKAWSDIEFLAAEVFNV